MSGSEVAVVIPVHNNGKTIGGILQQVLAEFPLVVCVDDGSTDESVAEIEKTSAGLIKIPTRHGYSSALQTGIEFALQNPRVRYLATVDERYDLRNLPEMLDKLKDDEDLDIVLGSRFARHPNERDLIMKAVTWFVNYRTKTKLTDLTRMRVFTREFGESLLSANLGADLEILEKIGANKWRYTESQL
ncbi:glycosyltransferase [Streptomyces sp. cg40]|uniref:glycosyltransferase n=1 Tax=Streptomyces sp. cg40 TaxID=3419764 RepID=UPI003CFFA568